MSVPTIIAPIWDPTKKSIKYEANHLLGISQNENLNELVKVLIMEKKISLVIGIFWK